MQRLILQELQGLGYATDRNGRLLGEDVHDLRHVSKKLAREYGGISHISFHLNGKQASVELCAGLSNPD
jgi:hypothetical protein